MEFLLPLHITFMSVSIMLVIVAVVTARRRKKNWLKPHRAFALWGVFSSVIAAACIAGLKMDHHYHHLTSPHAIAGLVTLCLLLLTPLLGASIAKGPHWLRPLHRLFGRTTAVVLLFTAVMGVFRFIQINRG